MKIPPLLRRCAWYPAICAVLFLSPPRVTSNWCFTIQDEWTKWSIRSWGNGSPTIMRALMPERTWRNGKPSAIYDRKAERYSFSSLIFCTDVLVIKSSLSTIHTLIRRIRSKDRERSWTLFPRLAVQKLLYAARIFECGHNTFSGCDWWK